MYSPENSLQCKLSPSSVSRVGSALWATVVLFLICLSAFSQSNQGTIQGGIFDQTGGAIAGATVSVIDTARGVTRSLTTDAAGEYVAPSLLPGTYTVRAESKGFRTTEHSGVLLEVGQTIRVDLTVQPGEQTQTVTVTGEIPEIDTTDSTLGGTVSNATINALPLNGRNFERLLQLRPGVITNPGAGAGNASTNGRRTGNDLLLVEGVAQIGPSNGTTTLNSVYRTGDANSLVPIDAIQEFNTQQNYKAEYGWRDGSVVNVGIKSGTNSIHGSAFAFGRDSSATDAHNFFTPGTATNATVEQFGAVAGGPIIKDKLFWFMGYEGLRTTLTNPVVDTIPADVPMGNTTFSMVDAYNKVGRASVSPLSAQLAGLPAGSCVPQPASSTFENLFPFNPGTNPAGPTAFAPFPLPNTTTENNGIVKINYHISDHNALSGSYFIADMPNARWVTSPDQLTSIMQNLITVRTRVFGSNWTYTPNSSWVNELRVGTNSITEIDTGPDNKNSQALPWPTGFGIPTGVSNPADFGMPYVQISSLNNFALGHGSTTRFRGPGGTTEDGENISYLPGKHAFKFGGDFFYLRLSDDNLRQVQGRIKFDDIESFLSGKPHKGNILTGNPQVRQRDASVAGFVQDDWRATKTLTLNLGLRYEFMPPSWEIDNQFGSFDPRLGLVQGWTVHPDYRNISPRLGLAWDINGNAKTVVRAAGSIIYQTADFYAGLGDGATGVPFGYDIVVNGITTPGSQVGSGSATFSKSDLSWNTTGPIFPAVVGRLQCGDGVAPDPGPCDTNFVDPNIRTPRVTNWNLDIQRALTSNLTLDVAYVGNHSHGQARAVQINQPAIGAGWFSAMAQNPGDGTPGSGNGSKACIKSAPLYNNCVVFNPYNTPLQPLYNQFPYIGFLDETK